MSTCRDEQAQEDAAVEALRRLWPSLGHPDHWTEDEASQALRRIVNTVRSAVPE